MYSPFTVLRLGIVTKNDATNVKKTKQNTVNKTSTWECVIFVFLGVVSDGVFR